MNSFNIPMPPPLPPIRWVGQRLSFGGDICTIRYKGKVEEQGDKEWLGVEWDNESRGKHNGTYNGKQYFKCLSPSPTAASFIPFGRKPDPSLSFLEGVRQKYASEVALEPNLVSSSTQIEISGKVVEEVGFDKIRAQLAHLDGLKIIILTGQRIGTALHVGDDPIVNVCPMIELIDLTSNLTEYFSEVVTICKDLPRLRTLKLNDNRFLDLEVPQHVKGKSQTESVSDFGISEGKSEIYQKILANITELEMQNVLLQWASLQRTMSFFTSLKSFDGSRNYLTAIAPCTISFQTLTTLVLDHNDFTSLFSIMLLSGMPCLEVLRLKANKITTIRAAADGLIPLRRFPSSLRYLDLSSNLISDWEFVDSLPDIFPGMRELRFSGNPVYGETAMTAGMATAAEDGFMLTVAMLGDLESLNFSKITAAERANAEMFYLSKIGRLIAAVPEGQEHAVISKHRRYRELCEKHGAPAIVRRQAGDINPNFLEARLLMCKFYLPANSRPNQAEITWLAKEIPKSFDMYRVKGIVGSSLGVQPLKVRLIWETGEWDPVAGYEDAGDTDDDENDADTHAPVSHGNGRMISREVELEDGTRPLGNWVDGIEATIRVEIIPSKPRITTYLDA